MNNAEFKINETFTGIDTSNRKPAAKEFDNCTFKECNFSHSDLSGIEFIDCTFEDCDLSMVNLTDAGMKGVKMINCKLMGTDFTVCNDLLFSINFESCNLDFAIFMKVKMKKTEFKDCSIRDANFTNTILSGSVFANCDLSRAIFLKTNLESVDFITACNFSIDPEANKIKKAKFSPYNITGLLDKYDISIE